MQKSVRFLLGIALVGLLGFIGCKKESAVPAGERGIVQYLTISGVEGDSPTKTGWKDNAKSGTSINGLYIKSSVAAALTANGVKYTPGSHKECDNVKNESLNKTFGNNHSFHKIYEKNATINGTKVELHYFRNNDGKIVTIPTEAVAPSTTQSNTQSNTGENKKKDLL